MALFRRRLREAVQYDGENWPEIVAFVGAGLLVANNPEAVEPATPHQVYDTGLGRWKSFGVGWFIVRGPDGEFYSVDADEWNKMYEEVAS